MTYRTYEIRWRNQYVSVTVAEERLGYRTRLRLLKDRPITVNSYRAESVRCQVVRPQKISHLRLTESDSLSKLLKTASTWNSYWTSVRSTRACPTQDLCFAIDVFSDNHR
jgi:hypothetical protein